jgi:RES domain
VTFSSPNAFRDFDRSVRRELRYVRTAAQEEFLAAVIATSDARTLPVKPGNLLWRAQLGHEWRQVGQGEEAFEVPHPHPRERMKPVPERATDGRANPRGIACLYLASHKETAALEVRPLIGSYVSVAQFKVLRDIRVVDCSRDTMDIPARWLRETPWTPEDVEKAVWSDINDAFSEPVERGDSSLDYVPTQILAEAFKRHGFDGVAYKSSYGEAGFNVALFDIASADLINCSLYRIKDVTLVMNEEGDGYFVN